MPHPLPSIDSRKQSTNITTQNKGYSYRELSIKIQGKDLWICSFTEVPLKWILQNANEYNHAEIK